MKTMDERGKPVLRFRPDGSFRVLMISDFHGKPDYNPMLTRAIETMVDYAKPDFVMLGGDQLCGITPEILKSYLSDVTEPMNRRGIPWAHVFGNHDGEEPMSKAEQEPVYEAFPLCLSSAGPADISGVGNYCLPVYARDGEHVAYHLYALDSHTNVHDFTRRFDLPDDTVFVLPNHFSDGHDQATPMFDQVMWYYNHSKNAEKEAGRKIPALLFLHVPLVEFCLMYRNPENVGFVGHKREDVACSELNSGLFFACLERGDVKGIFAGHEHLCDFQGQYCGVTLAYDCCLGYDMSTHDDMRGGRIIDITQDGGLSTRQVRLWDIAGEKCMRSPDFFEGGDKYYIRDLHT